MANPTAAGVLDLLSAGDMEVLGLLPYSSNYTFLARLGGPESEVLAVYKPRRGERPLWDFESGSLAGREVAAYLVSEAGGWDIVPPTVLRADAPLGEGSVQLFVPHDPERHYFVLEDERLADLAAFAAFDVVINNADRKAGHVLEDADGRLWAVDHGVSFHVEPKLRTVIWAFADQAVDEPIRARVEQLVSALDERGVLTAELAGLLTGAEIDALRARAEVLLVEGRFPPPRTDRPLPWPLV